MIELLLLIETTEDKITFEKLYKNIYRKLLFTAQKILHSQQDAEDIVHDVFARIAKDYHKYRGKSQNEMLSLGFVMVRNASINLIHARERHNETPIEIKDELLDGSRPARGRIKAGRYGVFKSGNRQAG